MGYAGLWSSCGCWTESDDITTLEAKRQLFALRRPRDWGDLVYNKAERTSYALEVGVVLGDLPAIQPPEETSFCTSNNSTASEPGLLVQSLRAATNSGIPPGFGCMDRRAADDDVANTCMGCRGPSPVENSWSEAYTWMEPSTNASSTLVSLHATVRICGGAPLIGTRL